MSSISSHAIATLAASTAEVGVTPARARSALQTVSSRLIPPATSSHSMGVQTAGDAVALTTQVEIAFGQQTQHRHMIGRLY